MKTADQRVNRVLLLKLIKPYQQVSFENTSLTLTVRVLLNYTKVNVSGAFSSVNVSVPSSVDLTCTTKRRQRVET